MGNKILKKIKHPYPITLYYNGNNPSIYFYFRLNQKSYRRSTGEQDIDVATTEAINCFTRIQNGKNIRKTKKQVLFKDALHKFIEHKKNEGVSSVTLKEYKRQSIKLIEKYGKKNIEEMANKTIYLEYADWKWKYYDKFPEKARQQFKRKANTKIIKGRFFSRPGNAIINREIGLLRAILRFAKEYMDVLQDKEIPKYTMLPEKSRQEIIAWEEYVILREYWTKKNQFYWSIIDFVYHTGIRYPSELNNIKWKDVNFDESYVLIRNRKNLRKNEPLHTKIPLISHAISILRNLENRNNISTNNDDYVFINDKGKRIKNINYSFKKGNAECGLSPQLTMYNLRHSYASMLVQNGFPSRMIAELLGHRDTTMVDRTYGHLNNSEMRNFYLDFMDDYNKKVQIKYAADVIDELFAPKN